MPELLQIKRLKVKATQVNHSILSDVNLMIPAGETLGILGASGSGKSMLLWSILNVLTENIEITGSITYHPLSGSIDLLKAHESKLREIRGKEISMIYQEPANSFNPVLTIGGQLTETIRSHKSISKKQAKEESEILLRDVGLDPDVIMKSYAHELSGGMCQRAAIALAISCAPKLLLADEPTSSLDRSSEQSILVLLNSLREKLNLTIVLVTHDLSVIKKVCNSLIVIDEGIIVEEGKLKLKIKSPQSKSLKDILDNSLSSAPYHFGISNNKNTLPTSRQVIIEVKGITHHYPVKSKNWTFYKKYVTVLSDIELKLYSGGIMGLIGASGSGKSTLAKVLVNLILPTKGEMKGILTHNSSKKEKARAIQMIFQDPHSALNPSHSIKTILANVLMYHNLCSKDKLDQRIEVLIKSVGLDNNILSKKPAQLSGGQKQRVCIARAISLTPKLLICDECVSALDASNRKKILDLLIELNRKRGISILFISHDIRSIAYISKELVVLNKGKIIEQGLTKEILENPIEKETQNLVLGFD